MKFRHVLAAALLPAVFVSQAAAAGYNFENLPLGPLTFPQDNWTHGGSLAVIESGAGTNTSHVLDSVNNQGAFYIDLWRTPIQGFGLPAPKTGDQLLFAADFRIPVSPRTTEAGFGFGIGSTPTATSGTAGSLGIRYDFTSAFNYDRLLAQRYDGASFAGAPINFTHTHGDWYHTQLILDLTGPSALASLYIQDLTTGSPLVPVTQVQNYNLNVSTSTINSLQWNSVYVEVGNVQLDNLQITTIPEPATATLLLVPAAALLLRRRRQE